MFESLSDRLSDVFKRFRGQGRLDESNIQEGLREVRLALLEADVNFKVVKEFVDRIRERCLGVEVMKSLTPGQQVVKIVHDEMVELLGGQSTDLAFAKEAPTIYMMVGLQGSGKTTTTGKLANLLRKQGKKPLMVPADVYRPAAIEQLHTLARQLSVPSFNSSADQNPVDIARAALAQAVEQGHDVVLLDTAGRLHIDEPLMQELANIKAAVSPQEILFVADAMTGQEAVNIAQSFNERLDISGVVLTKMDGDARGGAALSIKRVLGKPVKLVGMGEKLSDLEVFHPDRAAGRILGMGDVLSLIEKAQDAMDEQDAMAMGEKMMRAEFDFEDFRKQMRQLKKIGSLDGLMKLIPGMGDLRKKLGEMAPPDKELVKVEAMINSMTVQERRQPKLLQDPSRQRRVARGSGRTEQEVGALLTNFFGMQQMMQQMMGGGKKGKKGGMPQLPRLPRGMGGLARGLAGGAPKLPPGMPGMEGLPGMDGLGGLGGMGGMGGMDGMGPGQQPAPPKSSFTKKKKSTRKKRKK